MKIKAIKAFEILDSRGTPTVATLIETDDDFKIISNPFTHIKQSIGIKKGNPDVLNFLNQFIYKLIKEGLSLIHI